MMAETFRDYDPDRDGAAVRGLWDRTFPSPLGGQTIDWLFRDGPGGPPQRAVAEIQGRVVAHAGAVRVRLRVAGSETCAGYSVAAMTDSSVRGRGLYARLGKFLYERMSTSGFALVGGFSNRSSHRLMTSRLGRTPVRPFPWSVRILRPFALAARWMSATSTTIQTSRPDPATIRGIHVSPCSPGEARLDEVWQRAGETVQIGAVRDAAFTQWRFGTRPSAGYRLLVAASERGSVGYAAYRSISFKGIPAGFLVDFLLAPGEEEAGHALLSAVVRLARQEGIALLSALQPPPGPARQALRRAGFLRVPELLHPQTIRFSYRPLGEYAACPTLSDPKSWLLSWADTDII